MFGRKSFTQEEIDHGKAGIGRQVATHKALVKAVGDATPDKNVDAALEAFEACLFNNMILVLDRPFVHRLRMVTGKDGNPLNEVELLCDSLMNNNGILRGNNVIKYVAAASVVKLEIGDAITLTAEQFERLAAAFFAELEHKFL